MTNSKFDAYSWAMSAVSAYTATNVSSRAKKTLTRLANTLVAGLVTSGLIAALALSINAVPANAATTNPLDATTHMAVAPSAMPPVQTQTAVAAGYDCANVTDWNSLHACVAAGGVVTVTQKVTVPVNQDLTVDKASTVLSTVQGTALNATYDTKAAKNAIFDITAGGTLTIGAADGPSFEYSGGTRLFAYVNANATFAIANGTFTGIDSYAARAVNGLGTVVYNDGGSVVIENGTFTGNKADRGGVIWQRGADSLTTIANGLFESNTSVAGDGPGGGVLYMQEGSIAISGGTFRNNHAVRGGAIGIANMQEKAALSITGGEFDSNTSVWAGGAVYHTNGQKTNAGDALGTTLITEGVTFKNNISGTVGGAIHAEGELTVTGGVFNSNVALGDHGRISGGGAISGKGTMLIAGGTFEGNSQKYGSVTIDGDVTYVDCSTEVTQANCRRPRLPREGGGAIRSDGGILTIQGKVSFIGNHAVAWYFMSGGGAIYVNGTLWVKNGIDGSRPQFTHNWTGVLDTQYQTVTVNGKTVNQSPVGGAGGAIFLEDGSGLPTGQKATMYLMGGEFTDNSSGYLGGAVYTEEGSISYIAKAVATGNTAGHFGGGFWLCPSGSGVTSKGGNIALYDNQINNDIDPNVANRTPTLFDGGQAADYSTSAGADFAIMNPFQKHETVNSNSFQLMDTWFTDRSDPAVTWQWDNQPIKQASGYSDDWIGGSAPGNSGAVTALNKEGALTDVNGNKVVFTDDAYTLKLSYDGASDKYQTGVALKAVVQGDASKQQARKAGAWSSASVRFTGNQSRLSGGAFGTNGSVLFSTPYTVSWQKVANKSENGTVVPDETKPLAGSKWLVTSEYADVTIPDPTPQDPNNTKTVNVIGGPFSADYWPTYCAAGDEASYEAGKCWKQETDANGTVTKVSAIVDDNEANSHTGKDDTYTYKGAFDNNPSAGGFDMNNLANGVYTVTEIKAPVGYTPETDANGLRKKYTFTVAAAQAQWNAGSANASTDVIIGNTARPGIAWDKHDADSGADIAATRWLITLLGGDGKPSQTTYTITDCTSDTDCTTDDGNTVKDYDDQVGGFRVNNLPAGKYSLEETGMPSDYWHETSKYYFTIAPNTTGETVVYPATEAGVSTDGIITNQKPTVAWSKVDEDDPNNTLLAGSEWEISGGPAGTPTATVVDCETTDDAQNACSKNVTNTTDNNGHVTVYRDIANRGGELRISGLPHPTQEGDIYTFTLKETKAPEGYVVKNVEYTFTIGYSGTVDSVKLKFGGTDLADNKVGNRKTISGLPLTGGDARSWLVAGGGLAVLAGVAVIVYERMKRRGMAGVLTGH